MDRLHIRFLDLVREYENGGLDEEKDAGLCDFAEDLLTIERYLSDVCQPPMTETGWGRFFIRIKGIFEKLDNLMLRLI